MRFHPLKTFQTRSAPSRGKSLHAALAAALGLLLVSGCSQYDQSVGSSVIGDGFEGTLKQVVIPVERDTTRTIGDYYKASTVFVPLGYQDGVTSEIVLRYTNFTGLGDSLVTVDSASVRLVGEGYVDSLGVQDFTPWRAVVNRIDSEIEVATLKYGDELDLTPIDTFLVDPGDTSETIHFKLDAETLFRWVNDTASYGLLIRPIDGEAHFLKKFYVRPSDPDQSAQLTVSATIQSGDEVIADSTVEIAPGNATFLVDDTLSVADDILPVSTGYVREALMYADFSRFSPTSVSINRVDLVLHVDTTWAHQLRGLDSWTWGYMAGDWFNSNPDSAAIGSELSTGAYRETLLSDTSDVLRITVTPICRSWVPEPDTNYGVRIRPYIEGEVTHRAGVYSSKAADSTLRPYFLVTYTEYREP